MPVVDSVSFWAYTTHTDNLGATVREQLLTKLAEVRDLLEQATCDGALLDLDSDEDEVGMDIGAALNTLEIAVRENVD